MQSLVRSTLWLLIVMLALSAFLALGGVAYLWFFQAPTGQQKDLPYLNWLLGLTITEMVGIALLVARKGLGYLPDVEVHKTATQTDEFMHHFLGSGSSATVVSNRLGWLASSGKLRKRMADLAAKGTGLEIITPHPISENVSAELRTAGVRFYVTGESDAPEARFTLINANRSGSEKLAIARGVHPGHEVTVFDTNSGPQVIAMAKDIIRKSKQLANGK